MLLCDCILIESLINLTFNKKDLNHWSEAIPNFEIQSIGANYQIYFLNFQIQKSKFLNVQAFNTKSKIQSKISNSKMDPKSIPHRIQIISKLPKLHSTFKSSKIFQLRTLKFPQHHLNLHQTISNKSPNLKLHLEFPISTIFSSILENSFSSYLIKLHRSFDKISDEQKNILPRKKKERKYSAKILLPVPEQRANWRPILVASESLLSPCQRRSFQLVSRDVQVALEIEMFRDLPVARHPLARPH